MVLAREHRTLHKATTTAFALRILQWLNSPKAAIRSLSHGRRTHLSVFINSRAFTGFPSLEGSEVCQTQSVPGLNLVGLVALAPTSLLAFTGCCFFGPHIARLSFGD